MTRQLHRQKRRALRKDGEKVLRSGLPLEPSQESLLGLAVVLGDCLGEKVRASRATDAAVIVHRLSDTTQRNARDKIAVACRKGCAYCCHTVVSAMAPEVFRVARAVRNNPDLLKDPPTLHRRLAVTANKPHEERLGQKLPCALLVDGICSVYHDRPSVCRKTASTALDDCVRVFEGATTGWTSPRINDVAAAASLYALSIALAAEGLDWNSYELSGALAVALGRDDAEAAWLAGEDVFHAVRRDARPPIYERNVLAAVAQIE